MWIVGKLKLIYRGDSAKQGLKVFIQTRKRMCFMVVLFSTYKHYTQYTINNNVQSNTTII